MKYKVVNLKNEIVILLRDDGYRFSYKIIDSPITNFDQEHYADWQMLMEYKHHNFGGIADEIAHKIMELIN